MNPNINILLALWGNPVSQAADVTAVIQNIFNNNIGAVVPIAPTQAYFTTQGIPDPAPNHHKSLVVTYSLTGVQGIFCRAVKEDGIMTIVVQPQNPVTILKAFYGNSSFGLDITSKLQAFINDPANSNFTVGSQYFFDACTNCADPSPGQVKFVMVTYELDGNNYAVCGQDGNAINLTGIP